MFFGELLDFSSNAFTFFTLADSTLGSQVKLVLPKGMKLMEFVSKSPRLYPSIVYDEASMGTLVLKETRIGKLGNFMKNAGLIALAVQTACFMKDAAVGKDMKEDFYALVKSIGSNAVTLYGWAGLQVSMVGVFAIDYALTKFTEEARRLHKQGIGEIYREYTLSRRSVNDWEERLWTLLEKLAASGRTNKFDVVLEHEVRDYCDKFWTDSDSPLYTLKLEKYPSRKEREELTAELTPEMQVELRRWLAREGVFSRLQDRLVAKMRDEHAKQVEEAAKILNGKGYFRVETSKKRSGSSWAGCTVWIYPDGGKPDSKWRLTLNDTGGGSLRFTLLGFFQSGFPTKGAIYKPGKRPGRDKPEAECLFRMAFPETVLVLPEEDQPAAEDRATAGHGGEAWRRLEAKVNKGRDFGTGNDHKFMLYTARAGQHQKRQRDSQSGVFVPYECLAMCKADEPPAVIQPGQVISLQHSCSTSTLAGDGDYYCVASRYCSSSGWSATLGYTGKDKDRRVRGYIEWKKTAPKSFVVSSGCQDVKMDITFSGCGSKTTWVYEWTGQNKCPTLEDIRREAMKGIFRGAPAR